MIESKQFMKNKKTISSAVSDKKKNDSRRTKFNICFYITSTVLLACSLGLLIFLICNLQTWSSNFVVVVGVTTGLFTLTTTLGSLFTYINSQRAYQSETNERQISNAESLIREFNIDYLEDSIQLTRMIEITNKTINMKFSFEPTLEIQDSKIDMFNVNVGEANYKNKFYISACSRLYTSGILSKEMVDFCQLVLKDKNKYESLSNRGRTEIESICRYKRIRILNFLEGLAVAYVNSTVDREMIVAQFSSFIQACLSQFYILIYLDEGLGCYPCLRVLANELLARAL